MTARAQKQYDCELLESDMDILKSKISYNATVRYRQKEFQIQLDNINESVLIIPFAIPFFKFRIVYSKQNPLVYQYAPNDKKVLERQLTNPKIKKIYASLLLRI